LTPASQAYFDTSVLVKRYVEEAGSSDAAPLFGGFTWCHPRSRRWSYFRALPAGGRW